MKLTDLLSAEKIIADLSSKTKAGVIDELSENISAFSTGLQKDVITSALLEREKLGSTGIENGIAIPHAKISDLDHIILAVGRSHEGINFDAHDGKPSHLFFVLLAPDNSAGAHLKTLARLSRLLKENHVREVLMKAESSEAIFNILKEEDEKLSC